MQRWLVTTVMQHTKVHRHPILNKRHLLFLIERMFLQLVEKASRLAFQPCWQQSAGSMYIQLLSRLTLRRANGGAAIMMMQTQRTYLLRFTYPHPSPHGRPSAVMWRAAAAGRGEAPLHAQHPIEAGALLGKN